MKKTKFCCECRANSIL